MTKKKTRSSLCNPVMFSTVMKDEELFRGLLARILPEKEGPQSQAARPGGGKQPL